LIDMGNIASLSTSSACSSSKSVGDQNSLIVDSLIVLEVALE